MEGRAAAGADPAVRGHAFLLGFPRSGTTLLEQALAGHPNVVALEEAPTLAEAYDAFLADAAGLARLARLTPAEADHWRAVYWREVAAHGVDPRGRVFLDKAPAGTLYLPLIAKLFPDAKLLFAIRDPRDVVLSCLRSSFQMNALTYAFTDLTEAARCYAACMDLADVYRRVLPISLSRFATRAWWTTSRASWPASLPASASTRRPGWPTWRRPPAVASSVHPARRRCGRA